MPPATGNNAVITVKVGGNRTSLNAVSNLAGVQLGFYNTETGGTPAFTCTSDADGDCSVIVPNTQPANQGGVNRDRRFWVRQIGTPGTHYTNPNLGTGTTVASDPYRFQTGTQLRNGQTYRSTVDFMIDTGSTNNEASGGIWQNSLNNPVFPAQCGIDVALVLDLSNSVTDTQLVQLKAAANGFVDSLTGTPSRVGTFTFATSAPATAGDILGLTSVSTPAGATTVKNKINGYNKPGGDAGGTNWDRGIYQVAQSTANFDVAIVITDGNPTFYAAGEGPGNRTRFREVENGIFSANAVKAESTKLIAFGVGAGIGNPGSGQNLRSISGPTLNTDYYQTTDYAAAGAQLRELALGNCEGSVTVVKQVVPSTAPPGTTTGATPAGGWTFAASNPASGITVTPPTSRITEGGTGAANFPLTFAGVTSGNLTLTETPQTGYILQQVGGANAVCTRVDTGASVPATNSGDLGFTVSAASTYPISCTVYNRAPSPAASVVLNKTWVVNDTTYPQGSQPPGLTASGLINGTDQPWGTPRTGFQQGDSVTLNESLGSLPAQCTLVSTRLTSANGDTVNLALPSNQTLANATNTYGITNTLTCQTRLSLDKTVRFGDAAPDSWTLTAIPPVGGALPGPTGTDGVTGTVTPGVTYTLREDGGDPAYIQLIAPNAVLRPGATGSMFCVEVGPDGETVIPGFADGLNGGVIVPFGSWVRCRAINETATLRLVKEVINDNGGTAVPSDWDLTATPTGIFPAGLPAQTRPGAHLADAEYFNVRPGVGYGLSEAGGPAGYANTDIECQIINPRGDAQVITLQPGDVGTCWFVNNDQPATLTLVKNVDPGDTGVDPVPATSEWTLTATGPTTVTGPGNSAAVTNQSVPAGTYALAESGGPAGWTGGAWSCDSGTLEGSNVTVPLNGNVTCTISNTADQPTLTLVKQVDAGTTGVDPVPAPGEWTLTATGPSTVSGPGNSAAVTNQDVQVGSYDLTETGGPSGWSGGSWVCVGGQQTDDTVAIALGDDVTCTITNTADQPTLTLVKTVINNNGGTALATAWTLAADGPTTGISGATGSTEVTSVPVLVGDYDLAESGGPAGYTAGDWDCGDAELDGDTVTVGLGDDVTCTINNDDQPAQLTLVKVVENGTTGADAEPADWTLTADGPTPVSGAGNSGDVTDQTVDAGSYTLTESDGPAGYAASTWTCTGGTLGGATVTVPNGGDVTCTITNTAEPVSLALIKVVDPGTTGATTPATAWTLTATGPTVIEGTTPATGATEVGTYELAEDGPEGWDASDWVCEGASASTADSVTVALGDNATCTITNTAQQPTLTLVKTVTNDNGGSAAPTDWTLSAAGPTTGVTGPTGSTAVTRAPVAVGTYALTETDLPGYTAGDWTCDGDTQNGSSVAIALGDDVVCTINNDDQPAELTLVKVVQANDSGSTREPVEWTLTAEPQDIEGQDTVSGNGDPTSAGGVNAVEVFAGGYQLSEDGPPGFEGSLWECTGGAVAGDIVTVPSGGIVTCTITNTAIAPRLTLVKTVTNDHGGTAEATAWTLSAAGPSPISGVTGSDPVTNAAVQVGTYTLDETGPGGYQASDWTCVNADEGDFPVDGADITLAEGDDVTCTINNDDEPATLTLVKVVENGTTGGTATAADWTLTATGETDTVTGPGGSDDIVNQTVDAGDYALAESVGPDGYTPGAWECGDATLDGGTVTVPNGGDVTCTITNTAEQPTLTLVKVVDPGDISVDPVPEPDEWTLSATGPTTVTGPGNSDDVNSQDVQIGNYSLSETGGPTGWSGGDWVCEGGDQGDADTVTIALGDDVTCTITNTPIAGSFVITKTADPESGSTVNPGDTVTYTITARNNSDGFVTDATVTDDLSDVLDNASFGTITPADAATLDGTTLTWTLPSPFNPGDTATLSYTVTVNEGAYYEQLHNVATPGPGGECVAPEEAGGDVVAASLTGAAMTAADDPEWCQTEHPTPGWTLEKDSDPASGSMVDPGEQVTYTLTITNDSNGVVTNAVVQDDLSEVLRYATLDSVPAGATLNGTVLTWQVPTVQPGFGAQLSYTVTVNADAYDVAFANVATPGDGGECTTCTTDHKTPSKPSEPGEPGQPGWPSEPGLPSTGGTSLMPLALGAGFLIVGVLVLAEARRRRLAPITVRRDG